MEKRSIGKVLDTLIVAFAIVAFWRGAWGLMDLYLFPHSPTLSFLVSIYIGIIILILTKNLIKKLI